MYLYSVFIQMIQFTDCRGKNWWNIWANARSYEGQRIHLRLLLLDCRQNGYWKIPGPRNCKHFVSFVLSCLSPVHIVKVQHSSEKLVWQHVQGCFYFQKIQVCLHNCFSTLTVFKTTITASEVLITGYKYVNSKTLCVFCFQVQLLG